MTEPDRWVGEARAKVNLRLTVLARERGGYHQIETVFQLLELADRVALELRPHGRVELEVSGVPAGSLGPMEANLATRAAQRFRQALQEHGRRAPGIAIRLDKHIPHGAGLGGGSSDAAAVLSGMERLTGGALGRRALLQLGGELGADVPFFLSEAARALAWGRGDRILPLAALPSREVVVVVPSPGIPTVRAYEILSAHREASGAEYPGGAAPTPPDDWTSVASEAVNDFERALFPHRPDVSRVKATLERAGAEPALLSGSGSAVFGVFQDRADAEAATRTLATALADLPDLRCLRTRTIRGAE